MASLSAFILFVLFPLVVVFGIILWVLETKDQKVRRMVQYGMSQRAVAAKLNVSRYYVSKVLKAA